MSLAYSRTQLAGVLFFVAAAQFILGITISEALYPGYSISDNYVSDLGTGPSCIIFNSSVFILGLLLVIGTYCLKQVSNLKTVNTLLVLMAVGAMGVGIFTQDFTVAHGVVSSMAFFFGGLSAIASFKVLKKPFSIIAIVLGLMTLGALALFSIGLVTSGSATSDITYNSSFYLGLGPGGMERMILYPALIWLAGFSAHLLQTEKAVVS